MRKLFVSCALGMSFLVGWLVLISPAGAAATIVVTTVSDLIADDGWCSLREAIIAANTNTASGALAGECAGGSGADTISFDSGLWPATFVLTRTGTGENDASTGDLDIRESVTIQGAGATSTIVDANSIDRAFQILSPAVVTMTGLTVQGGSSGTGSAGGGVALASGARLTLEDVTLSGNTAGDTGGGIYNNGGDLVLRRVRVADNHAANAAGIRNSGSLSMYDSTIANNHANQYGGGLMNTGSLTLEGVTVSGNVADTNGGGLYLHSADPATGLVSITNSTISGNWAKAYMGGGIWVYYQTELWLSSSTVANNTAGQGGGIFNYHQQGVAGLWSQGGPDSVIQQEGNIHLHNSIVANNTVANCGRSAQTFIIHSLGYNLDSSNSCELSQASDQTNTNPQLLALGDNGGPTATRALSPGSPAIDAGDDADCPATDQRGVSRPQGGGCDIGAYEANPAGEANLGIRKRDDPDPVQPGAPLTYTLSISNTGPYTATAITVTDQLPAGVSYSSASGNGWGCSRTSGALTCTRPNLAVGPAPDILINLLAPTSAGSITNTASVTSTVADPSPGNNFASQQTLVESVPLEEANLGIGKRDDPDPVQPGAPLTYTLSISNTGPYTATAVQVTDTLPIGVVFTDASGSGWECSHAGGEVTCTRPELAVGPAPDILIHLLAPTSVGSITNTASVTSTLSDPSPGNNFASQQTLVESVPLEGADLSISKTGSATSVEPGGWLTYTLVVSNVGPDMATAITVTDPLPPEVTYNQVSGTGWSCGHGGGTVTCTRASLAVGAAPDILIRVTAPGHTCTITNTATVSNQVVDPTPNNNGSAPVTTQVGLVTYVYLPLVLR